MTVTELENSLKEQKIMPMYILYGKELYLLENCLKKIKKIFGNLIDGLNYIKIDNSNIDSLISEMQTPPFGYEKKINYSKINRFVAKTS